MKPSVRWPLVSLCLSMLMPSFDTSIANAALPTLAQAFGASFQAVQWIVLAYLLSITTLIVTVGRLGDLVGRRRLLLAGIAFFTAASLLCGLAPTLGLLIAARAAQGLGAAVMMALTVALVADAVPKSKAGSAIGLLGTMSAIGTALGPSLGGFLISGLGWRTIFLVNVPLGLVNLLLAQRHLPVDLPRPTRPRFDVWGTATLSLTLAAYALAMSLGHLALLFAAALGLVLFVAVEHGATAPLLRLDLLRNPALGGRLARGALVSTVMMATLVVGPFYLARALGLHPAQLGVALSVGPFVAALSSVAAGRGVDIYGADRMARTGLGILGLAATSLALLPTQLGLAGYLIPIAFMTAGYAVFQSANNTAVLTDLDPGERGVVSGLLSLSRNLGLITGASAMGAVFAFAAGTSDLPEVVATGMRTTFAVAAVLISVALALVVKPATPQRGRARVGVTR